MLANLKKIFTVGISSKFATRHMSYFPPHLPARCRHMSYFPPHLPARCRHMSYFPPHLPARCRHMSYFPPHLPARCRRPCQTTAFCRHLNTRCQLDAQQFWRRHLCRRRTTSPFSLPPNLRLCGLWYGQFRRLLKLFLTVPNRNIFTYLHTYMCTHYTTLWNTKDEQ